MHGVWIPSLVLEDRELNSSEKILVGYIAGFGKNGGECFASNSRIAADLGTTPAYVQKMLGVLIEKGVIHKRGSHQWRKLTLDVVYATSPMGNI